jgi:hypothetical protein
VIAGITLFSRLESRLTSKVKGYLSLNDVNHAVNLESGRCYLTRRCDMTTSNRTDLFTTAFKVHTLGFPVIPSGGGKSHKAPLVPWAEYQTRQPTDEELQDWEEQYHSKLWGIVTGVISGVVVIDADTPEARAELEAELGKPHVITPGGGAHWYFTHPGHEVKTVAGILPDVDIRGDGGFVNTVGTRPDGEYKILTLPAPDNLIPWARLPERLRAAMIGSRPSGAVGKTIPEVIQDGQRNATLTSLAGSLRSRGIKQSVIEDTLKGINQAQCQPPLPEKDVIAVARSVSRYEPKSADTPASSDVKLRCMADVKAEAVSWLWKPYIPKGKLTLEEGDPGIGKSWVSLAIATGVTLGKGLPGQEISESGNVLLASAEDGLGDTIRPRLDAMGADVSRILAIDGALTLDDSGFALLEAYLERVSPALLIIDPLVAYIGAGVDIHRANETRSVMAQLARLAEKYEIAILAVRHLTKGSMSKAIYRGLGSIDITAACRSVLMAGSDPDNPQNRALVHIKSNLAPAGPSIGYELREGGFYWTGESPLTATQILAADNGEGKSARDEAADFLRDELRDGPVEWQQIEKDRKEAGITEITLRRARESLGVRIRREGEPGRRGGGRSVWELPEALGAQKDLLVQPAHIEKKEQVNQASFTNDPLPQIGEQVNITEALPCVKSDGTCWLRTDASKHFDCAFTLPGCSFWRRA